MALVTGIANLECSRNWFSMPVNAFSIADPNWLVGHRVGLFICARGLRPACADFGLRCLRHLRWYRVMFHGTSFLWRFGNQDFLTSSLRSSDGWFHQPVLSPPTVATRLRLGHMFVGNLRFPPFSRSPAGMFPPETRQGVRIYVRECGSIDILPHSAFFCAKSTKHCVITMGTLSRFPIFGTLPFGKFFLKNTGNYTWMCFIGKLSHLSMAVCTVILQKPKYFHKINDCPGFLRNPSRNGNGRI